MTARFKKAFFSKVMQQELFCFLTFHSIPFACNLLPGSRPSPKQANFTEKEPTKALQQQHISCTGRALFRAAMDIVIERSNDNLSGDLHVNVSRNVSLQDVVSSTSMR